MTVTRHNFIASRESLLSWSLAVFFVFLATGCTATPAAPKHAPAAPSAPQLAEPSPTSPTAPSPTIAATAPQPAAPKSQAPAEVQAPAVVAEAGMRQVFPSVRLDAEAGIVEFDGIVPIDVRNPKTPDVYLEAIACTRDSMEHESLVMTDAKPSHVHSALLLAGGTPGKPGEWDWTGPALKAIPPTGTVIDVSFRTERNGEPVEEPASMWVARITDGALLPTIDTAGHWVFAGSREVVRGGRTWYEADGSGTLIGLATFGGETLGWTTMYNPDSGVAENVWIADQNSVPTFGTPVTVVLRVRR